MTDEARDPVLLHDELVDILAADLPTQEATEAAVRSIMENRGEGIYSDLIWNLTSLRYDTEEAKRLWQEVLAHKYVMSERLGRNVGVRVAVLDYFSNILGRLARPRVIDPAVLERLYNDATVDPLTGLANRRHFRERFQSELVRARRYSGTFTLALFDIDDFKMVNDTRGHAEGDRILVLVADAIRAETRQADLGVRWGGEEFAILMPASSKAGGMILAERLRERIEKNLRGIGVTISGGLASFPVDGQNERELFAFADRTLYRAKAEGKNRICPAPIERRAAIRMNDHVRVRFHPVTNGWALESMTQNIGGVGLMVKHSDKVEKQVPVAGELEVDDKTFPFVGSIARVDQADPNSYEVGVQFTNLTPEMQQELVGRLLKEEGEDEGTCEGP